MLSLTFSMARSKREKEREREEIVDQCKLWKSRRAEIT